MKLLRKRWEQALLFCTSECTENPGNRYKRSRLAKISVSAYSPPKLCLWIRLKRVDSLSDSFPQLFVLKTGCGQNPSNKHISTVVHSVPDPHVFGPPGSGSISQRCVSGSFYHPSIVKKIVRTTLILTVFVTSFDLFIFEKWCKCTFKK